MEEFPTRKALKVWANNERHIKCVDGKCLLFLSWAIKDERSIS